MNVQDEISRLARDGKDLAEFLTRACGLMGKGVTRASVEAGLSRNTISSYVLGDRRPSAGSAYRLGRYFGVPETDILRLAGVPTTGVESAELEGLAEGVRALMCTMDEEEVREWMQYGEMLLLRRSRRIMEGAHGKVER